MRAPDHLVMQRLCAAIAKARAEQRDEIGDSDLDDEQPIRLSVSMTLGDARAASRLARENS